jgi:DNA polymerase (family 10)
MAVKMGLKVNEYGVFQMKDDKKIAGKDESEIYRSLGIPFIMPELREDRGEFEAAQKNKLPSLVDWDDIQGDLHIHTKSSDGLNTIEEIVQKAKEKRYQYVAITDHSQSLQVAGGLNEKRLEEQMKMIDELNQNLDDFTVLKGIEVDIKSDGTLDLPNNILRKLDIVIAAIHSGFKQERAQIMQRLISAMRNPYVNIIAHPTGRIIGYREPYAVDMQEIIQIAVQTNTSLEINASPERMDLNDIYTKSAREKNVQLSLGTDAHQLAAIDYMIYGVSIARRGWLEKKDILNTLSLSELKQKLKKNKSDL